MIQLFTDDSCYEALHFVGKAERMIPERTSEFGGPERSQSEGQDRWLTLQKIQSRSSFNEVVLME